MQAGDALSRTPSSYRLTAALIADHIGSGVLCFAGAGLGRRFQLHAHRPDARINRLPFRFTDGAISWRTRAEAERTDLPSGVSHVVEPVEASPALIRVDIVGAIEQNAGFYNDPSTGCMGWSDGHDAICDRFCAACAEGDVLLVVNSPGGAAAEIPGYVRRGLAAKEKYGRRVTGFGKPMIGSAATWWANALCDEIFGDVDSEFGSIGARGQHVSIAGALAKEGIKWTYFADPPDKIAFAPQFDLGPVGEMRGNRDVKIAADAFRAAVCAGPLGKRRKLTPEYLVELGADMLTGQAAVEAGLADGVASFDEVVAYALDEAAKGAERRANQARVSANEVRARAQRPRRAA